MSNIALLSGMDSRIKKSPNSSRNWKKILEDKC